jgi:hypothetical protein
MSGCSILKVLQGFGIFRVLCSRGAGATPYFNGMRSRHKVEEANLPTFVYVKLFVCLFVCLFTRIFYCFDPTS